MSTPRSRRARLALAATLAGSALALPAIVTTAGQLTASSTVGGNSVTTRAACVGGPLYAQAVSALNPSFYWRVAERTPPAVTQLADTTTNNLNGTVRGTGLTFGVANVGQIACDNTYSVRFRGQAADNGFVVQQTAVPNTDTFTLSAWVRSTSTRGGWIVGMGSARWGTSTNRDRVLYLQRNGRPTFSVGIAPRRVIEGPTAVNDGNPHLLVATLGPAGMVLYVDGVQVAANPSVTAGASYTGNEPADQPPPAVPATPDGFGYWRLGYDSTAGLGPVTPTRNQLAARIDEVALWQSTQLGASAVNGLYAQNHW